MCATAANGPASLSLGEEQAWLHISRGLTTLASQLGNTMTRYPQKGDTLANTLLDGGAEQCERLLSVASDTLPVYLVGGLAEIYRSRLSASIQSRLRQPHGDAFSALYALSQTQQGCSL